MRLLSVPSNKSIQVPHSNVHMKQEYNEVMVNNNGRRRGNRFVFGTQLSDLSLIPLWTLEITLRQPASVGPQTDQLINDEDK